MRAVAPNPLDKLLKVQKKHILLFWNRGLGDIALGLYAIAYRIKEKQPNAKITFLIREDLQQGFSLFEGVSTIIAKDWKRGERYSKDRELKKQKIDPEDFDEIIEWPDPTYWVKWQRGKLTPKLTWKEEFFKDPGLLGLEEKKYIAVQPLCETNYGLWRNFPESSFQKLFEKLEEKGERIILLGKEAKPEFKGKNIVDLRGKTDLYQLLSLMQKRVKALIVPDSGVLSMSYYLNKDFPIKVISLWADPNHGILKQNVASPNKSLTHIPLIAKDKDLSKMSVEKILEHL